MISTDIDIDAGDRDAVLELFNAVPAITKTGTKHNTGVYFHKVPINPLSGYCSVSTDIASTLGFFKIDVLNVNIYTAIKSHAHLDALLEREPIWELLESKDFCDLLFHMSGHDALCKQMKPRSIKQLAAILAIIRPSKRHLAGQPWDTVFDSVWVKPTDGTYYFKKAHSFSYALAVMVHMNLITESYEQAGCSDV
jgi:hypothetical protein